MIDTELNKDSNRNRAYDFQNEKRNGKSVATTPINGMGADLMITQPDILHPLLT